jgi:hypothetical protein
VGGLRVCDDFGKGTPQFDTKLWTVVQTSLKPAFGHSPEASALLNANSVLTSTSTLMPEFTVSFWIYAFKAELANSPFVSFVLPNNTYEVGLFNGSVRARLRSQPGSAGPDAAPGFAFEYWNCVTIHVPGPTAIEVSVTDDTGRLLANSPAKLGPMLGGVPIDITKTTIVFGTNGAAGSAFYLDDVGLVAGKGSVCGH